MAKLYVQAVQPADLNKNTEWFMYPGVWTTYILILFFSWLLVLSVFGCTPGMAWTFVNLAHFAVRTPPSRFSLEFGLGSRASVLGKFSSLARSFVSSGLELGWIRDACIWMLLAACVLFCLAKSGSIPNKKLVWVGIDILLDAVTRIPTRTIYGFC